MIKFILNETLVETDVRPTTVLLDFIRKEKKLTGTKEGCREGDCGACTVLLGVLKDDDVKYKSVNSCLVPLGDVNGCHVFTVEGINNGKLSPIQEAMVDQGGTQCGFCTPGFVISMTGYFLNNKKPEFNDAVEALGGNVCRCTGYGGIKRAVGNALTVFETERIKKKSHLETLIELGFIPAYFENIKTRLSQIRNSNKRSGKKVSTVVSGGTDLYVQKWESLVRNNANLISSDRKIYGIEVLKHQIKLGAATTIEEIRTSPVIQKYFPGLSEQLKLFGSLPIRNRATVGGNIVNASPIGDFTNILIALDAELHLKGMTRRSIFLRDFYKGYKVLNKRKDELIESITFPIPPKNFRFNFEKVSKRTYLDIASVNSTLACIYSRGRITCVGLSAGGVAPVPLFLKRASEFMNGKDVTAENIIYAADVAMKEIFPISDARGSAEYKRLLLRQLIYAHFLKLFPDKFDPEKLF